MFKYLNLSTEYFAFSFESYVLLFNKYLLNNKYQMSMWDKLYWENMKPN